MTRLNYYYATVKIFTSLLIIESFGCHQFGNVELIEFLLDGVGGERGSVGFWTISSRPISVIMFRYIFNETLPFF